MVEFWEAVRDILVIAIPTTIGALSSRFIINSWQAKKEEFELKKKQYELRKQIFSDYEKAYVRMFSVIDKFASTIFDAYISKWVQNPTVKYKIGYILTFPKDEKEFPHNKFANEYKKFKEDMMKCTDDAWKFFSTVRVYYNLEDISESMTKITETSTVLERSVHLIVYSTNQSDFDINYELYNNSFKEFREINHELSHILATKEFNKPIKKRDSIFKKRYLIFKK